MTQEDEQLLLEHLNQGRYLPPEFRDFHDQKALFKTIGTRDVSAHAHVKDELNFRQGMIYVIDHFLHFMAMHGYEMKRVNKRNPIPRYDLSEAIERKMEEMREEFHAMRESLRNEDAQRQTNQEQNHV